MSAFVEFVSVAAWPSVTVWFVKKYGDDVKTLILRISKIKMGSAEAEFSANLSMVEAIVTEKQQDSETLEVQSDNSEFNQRVNYLKRIAETSPRAAIMESWLLIEEAAERDGFINKEKGSQRRSISYFIDSLVEEKRINKSTANLISEMQRLRNKAAHFIDFDLTKDEAERYIKTAVQVSLLINNQFMNMHACNTHIDG
ncbi:DUF4145 domain-containing protein [Citrobacter sp. wls708]|uniref:DUF4145 domain-containing protein n=1 Tax=Citrobacter sp. wls708 TaxID=2576427 RepID=UPI002016AC6D|nr:DUF4145 domain-containing protein [Citrobacter sp. wls708]